MLSLCESKNFFTLTRHHQGESDQRSSASLRGLDLACILHPRCILLVAISEPDFSFSFSMSHALRVVIYLNADLYGDDMSHAIHKS